MFELAQEGQRVPILLDRATAVELSLLYTVQARNARTPDRQHRYRQAAAAVLAGIQVVLGRPHTPMIPCPVCAGGRHLLNPRWEDALEQLQETDDPDDVSALAAQCQSLEEQFGPALRPCPACAGGSAL